MCKSRKPALFEQNVSRDMTILSQKLSDTLQDAMRKQDSQMKSQFDEIKDLCRHDEHKALQSFQKR